MVNESAMDSVSAIVLVVIEISSMERGTPRFDTAVQDYWVGFSVR